jgi:hypothetical protein
MSGGPVKWFTPLVLSLQEAFEPIVVSKESGRFDRPIARREDKNVSFLLGEYSDLVANAELDWRPGSLATPVVSLKERGVGVRGRGLSGQGYRIM